MAGRTWHQVPALAQGLCLVVCLLPSWDGVSRMGRGPWLCKAVSSTDLPQACMDRRPPRVGFDTRGGGAWVCGADSLPGKIICLSKLRLDSVLPASAGGGPGWAVSSDVSNPAGACPSLQLAPCFSEIPQALGFLITSCAAATQQGVQGALQSCLHLIDTRKLENMKPPLPRQRGCGWAPDSPLASNPRRPSHCSGSDCYPGHTREVDRVRGWSVASRGGRDV